MKKVTLVSIGVSHRGFSQFASFLPTATVSLYYIAAVLKNTKFYDVEIIDQPAKGYDDIEILNRINNSKSEYVFFSQFFNTRQRVKELISKIDYKPIILIGGHDATFHTQTLSKDQLGEEYCDVDYIWQGEVERDLLSELPHFTKQTSPTLISKLSRRIEDLNQLPILKHVDYPGTVGFLSTSRGCYRNGCGICTTPGFYPTGWMSRSIDHVKKEIFTLKKAGKEFVFICDDNFLGFTDKQLQRGHEIIMQCKKHNIKVMIMTIKEQLLKALSCGYLPLWKGIVYKCFIGIESGGPHVESRIGKITDSSSHVSSSKKVVQQLYRNGISLFAGWINFKPDSTFYELKLDADFLLKTGSECAIFTNLCQSLRLYEGTKIYEKHKHRNIILRGGEFDYDFDIPEIGELYRFLMFNVRNEITNQLDNLIFELTDLIYIQQLQDTGIGQKYWQIRNCINEHNYNFFMQCLTKYKAGCKKIDRTAFISTSQKFISQLIKLKSFCEINLKEDL